MVSNLSWDELSYLGAVEREGLKGSFAAVGLQGWNAGAANVP